MLDGSGHSSTLAKRNQRGATIKWTDCLLECSCKWSPIVDDKIGFGSLSEGLSCLTAATHPQFQAVREDQCHCNAFIQLHGASNMLHWFAVA